MVSSPFVPPVGASATPKRLLIVIGTLAIGGGAEKVASTLGSELTARGHKVHLLTFYEAEEKYPFNGIYHTLGEQLIFNRLKKIWRIPLRVYAIQRYAKTNKIEVAISFLEEANFYTLLAKLSSFFSLPVIVSVRNNIEKREWPFKLMTKLLYPFAKKVVSVTRAVEETLKTKYRLKNTTTIYNPLDLELIEISKSLSIPSEYESTFAGHPICITIGRLTHQKGQWHLIRAFVEVKKQIPTAKLVIIGDGELKAKLENLVLDCDLQESVHLLGKHENVYRFLARSDLFVFSSLWEGMPNTMLEALAIGLPIVSPDCVSGPREIIAPEVPVSAIITYPLATKTGTLTAPLAHESVFASPSLTPLTSEEMQLTEEIARQLKSIQAKKETKVEDGAVTPSLAPDPRFTLGTIISEWEKEINL